MSKGTEINWHFEKSYVLGKKYEDMFISIVKDMKARQYPIKIVRFIFRDQTGTVEASESPLSLIHI